MYQFKIRQQLQQRQKDTINLYVFNYSVLLLFFIILQNQKQQQQQYRQQIYNVVELILFNLQFCRTLYECVDYFSCTFLLLKKKKTRTNLALIHFSLKQILPNISHF